jgi:uncharacterized damage-inducible protein DinB
MPERVSSERERYLASFEREFQTTRKVLHAFPPDKSELKPTEKGKSARQLGWMLVLNQMVVVPTIAADLKPGGLPQAPGSWSDVLAGFDQAHADTTAKLQTLGDEQMNRTIRIPTGPKQVGEMRVGDALWFFLNDTIHHRGQFSVYLRIAGGKVPSIYGPTADESWS